MISLRRMVAKIAEKYMKRFTLTLEDDGHGNVILPIPDEICDVLGWEIDDVLSYSIDGESLIITKDE